MKISEVTLQHIKDYARIDYTDDDLLIDSVMSSVKSYIKGRTGLTNESMDLKEDLTIAFIILCKEMCVNKNYLVANDKVNPVVESILDMHSTNLL